METKIFLTMVFKITDFLIIILLEKNIQLTDQLKFFLNKNLLDYFTNLNHHLNLNLKINIGNSVGLYNIKD